MTKKEKKEVCYVFIEFAFPDAWTVTFSFS